MKLSKIAQFLSCKLIGSDCNISGINTLEEAKEGDLTFLTNPRYQKFIETTKASAILIDKIPEKSNKTFLLSDNPYLALAKLAAKLFKIERPSFKNHAAYVGEDCTIADSANIYPTVYIGSRVNIGSNTVLYPGVVIDDEVEIGDDCVIYPNVSIMRQCRIEDRVIIHAGTVIGSDGYGYALDKAGNHIKIPQIGIVKIESDVEIGSNVSIDRAAFGQTLIGRGTKIDNLVQIAHNVKMGEKCLIISQVGISGSSTLGDNVILAGQVGVAGHIRIDSNVQIGAKSGIHKSLKTGQYSGVPTMNHRDWLKLQAVKKKLPSLLERMKLLEKEFLEIKGKHYD